MEKKTYVLCCPRAGTGWRTFRTQREEEEEEEEEEEFFNHYKNDLEAEEISLIKDL